MDRKELEHRLMKLPKSAIIQGFLAEAGLAEPSAIYRAAVRVAYEADQALMHEALDQSVRYSAEAVRSQLRDDAEAAHEAYQEYTQLAKRVDRRWRQLTESYRL